MKAGTGWAASPSTCWAARAAEQDEAGWLLEIDAPEVLLAEERAKFLVAFDQLVLLVFRELGAHGGLECLELLGIRIRHGGARGLGHEQHVEIAVRGGFTQEDEAVEHRPLLLADFAARDPGLLEALEVVVDAIRVDPHHRHVP